MSHMRKDKRVRLERSGWKVGTVRDLLGLSKAEEALIVLSVRERRNPRDQGGLLIEEKLREIGLLEKKHEALPQEQRLGAREVRQTSAEPT